MGSRVQILSIPPKMKFEIKKIAKWKIKEYEPVCLFCDNTPTYSIKTFMDIDEPFRVPMVCTIHMNKFFRKIRNLFQWELIVKDANNQVAEKARTKLAMAQQKKQPY